MADNRRRKKKIPVKETIIVFAVVVLLGLIFLIASGGRIYKSAKANASEIEQNGKLLKELEERVPETVKEEIPKPAPELNLNTEEDKIMSMTLEDYDDALARRWFQGSVILGDSITMAAAEYGYLDYDVILARIGAGLENSGDLIADAVSRHPSVLFLFFGANDISNYLGDPELFVSQYRAAVGTIRSSLPDTPLYLIAILPEQEGVGYEEGYEYREQYNEALKKYCDQTENVYYINTDFILERNTDFYDADGIHPTAAFYPRWLTCLADVSGLSSKTDGTD